MEGGYVALMATIVIGAFLLLATIDIGMQGAAVRFSILGNEAKEQAKALAQGCVDQAGTQLLIDTTFRGGATTTGPIGTCYVFPFLVDVPSSGLVTFTVQAIVRQSVTNLVVIKKYNFIHLAPVPESSSAVLPAVATVETVSVAEVATLP